MLFKVVGFELGFGIIAIILSFFLNIPSLSRIHFSLKDVALSLLFVIPPLFLFWGLFKVNFIATNKIKKLLIEIAKLFKDISTLGLGLISIAAGLGEELLFRAVIQGTLSENIGSLFGIIIASTLFGLCHIVTITYAIITTIMGFYLGLLFLSFENLIVPILVHSVYDFIALHIIVKWSKKAPLDSTKLFDN